jgi:hypothetical protein
VNYVYGDAAPADGVFFVADRPYFIVSAVARIIVAGTDPGVVTAQIRKANNTASLPAGAVLHAGTINLKGAVDTNQVVALVANEGTRTIQTNWSVGMDVTGVTTAARGVVSLLLLPL